MNLMNFVYNLKYMGVGMLGIFVVIGVIILITMFLNKVTENKE
ncbi:MAG: oxaloacetate decarboxylase [Clostridia bacterium]|nr:oxaloacetate decarboxylase [Clostridia bacterium]